MKNFKEQLINDFIPRIKEMIKKEEVHLINLKEYRRKSSKKIFNFITSFNIDDMINESSKTLNHLKTRLKEYIEYSEKINN